MVMFEIVMYNCTVTQLVIPALSGKLFSHRYFLTIMHAIAPTISQSQRSYSTLT